MKEDMDSSQLKFKDVYDQEKAEVRKRRQKNFYADGTDGEALTDLVGLALSGGGIRSATFCLGFLQELHRLKLLRIFDYLSTVSGGGYVGGWWSAWLSRDEVLVRAKEEPPIFTVKDIKNVASLVTRLIDPSDEVSRELVKQMRSNESGLQTMKMVEEETNDAKKQSSKLVKNLVAELNIFLSKPPRPGAPDLNWPDLAPIKTGGNLEADEEARKAQQARLDERNQWTNRIHLEHTYPYELRNIFPPPEEIEPERKYTKAKRTESESSICAWTDPIHHLRLFANYLTPRKGLLSADTWRAVSVITRNLLLTWLILLPILTAVMLLGQSYFLFTNTSAFMQDPPVHISWLWVLPPIGILLGLTVVMTIAWLLCNRDTTSSADLLAQIVCFVALGGLLVSGIWMVPHLKLTLLQILESHRSWVIGSGGFTLITILIMWNWKISRDDLSGKDRETVSRWKREVRRGRFSRAQARLLVLTTIVATVLLVSWLSCSLFSDSAGSSWSLRNAKYSFAWFPFVSALISAIGGSIFTALRAAPSAGTDKPASHKPSAISRFIFTATPSLVVLVLAVLAAWFAHWLLYVALTAKPENVSIPLRAAGFLIITLGLALALYEMKDVKWSGILKPTVFSLIFMALLMVNASWLWQAWVAKVPGIGSKQRWLASAILAIFATVVVLQRAIPREKWKFRLIFPHLRLGLAIFVALTVIGKAIGEAIFSYTSKPQDDKILGALVLALAALAGGTILYRLLTVRGTNPNQRYLFESRLFKYKRFSKRPEWLWSLASLCLILPLTMLSLAHELNPNKIEVDWNREPILFPASLAVLLASLIALRSLVLQRPKSAPPLVGLTGKPFDWILKKIKANSRSAQAFRLLAFLALGATIVGDTVMTNQFANASIGLMGPVMIKANWIFTGIALLINMPIFGVSVFKLPAREGFSPSLTFKDSSWIYRKATLWVLAFVCVTLALLAGYSLTNWLEQLSRIELHFGLTPVLLPVAAGCLLMIIFEMSWGSRENRRSIWLIGLAYLGIGAIFFIGLVKAQEAEALINSIRVILGLFAAVCVWVVSLGWMVDPNAVSMHQFYRSRLVRAYLGASNIRRRRLGNKEITDTVAGDDLPLKSLSNCERGGPYHLINTTLNLVAGRDLATAQRSASSFILSQKYCGSGRTNYRPTEQYLNGQLSLGTAIAASGAAVSPNMGSKKPTAALAMLMTLLNVRLGYWAPTPNQDCWNSSQPRVWPFYLIREFLSQTNDLSSYCYLTDGGHFDNTGLYSLIERGCRFVVLLDCGADPQPSCFQDLGEVIRRCRIDFGTEIDLNLDLLIATPGAMTEGCFVVGNIKFSPEHLRVLQGKEKDAEESDQDDPARTGTIVYFKPSVMDGVTADVRQYAIENKLFPQQTTANQWFDEAQFESYRRLGMECANKAFANDVAVELGKTPRLKMESIEALFVDLRSSFQNQI